MQKNYALYVPIFRNVLHSTSRNAEKLRNLRANIPKRPALHKPKCRKITPFTWQNAKTSCTPHVEMPKNCAFYVPKSRNALHYTSRNAEKLRNLVPECLNVLHFTCRNTETSHALHTTMSKRTNIPIVNFIYQTFKAIIPPDQNRTEQNTLPSHYKDHSVNFAWSSSLCLP